MSATNMTLFLLLGFSLLLHHEIEGITTHSVTKCSDSVLLNCSNTEIIHVERITYYNGTDCNQAETDLQVCGQPETGSDTGLAPACNGKTSCNESVFYNTCPGSKAAKVDYRCIPGNNVKDICGLFVIKHISRIFVSTPNYALTPSFTYISPCRCFIRGASITSIQILELLLQSSNDGNKSSVDINYGNDTYKVESFNSSTRRVYNKRLSRASTSAEIILNHNNINRLYLWIEVQGVAMHVACNIGTPSPSTTPDSSSPAADIKSHSQGITTHSVTGCTKSVLLNCSTSEMTHVERVTYYNGTDCNQNVTDLQVCGPPVTGCDTGLTPACNGKTCSENLHNNTCPGSKAAKLDYRCIPRSNVKKMCDEFIIKNTNRIFLSARHFPLSRTFTDIPPCICSIRGTNITSIQILELTLQTPHDGNKSSLEINYGDVTYKAESNRVVSNKRLSTTSTAAEIILNRVGSNIHLLLIEVQGVAMHVACNIVTPSPSPSTTPDSSSPQTADIICLRQDKVTNIKIITVLYSLCLLIIYIAAPVVLKRRGYVLVKETPEKARQTNRGGGPRESDEETCLKEDSGSDGDCVELDDGYSTPQYNNVSQTAHPEYHNLNLLK